MKKPKNILFITVLEEETTPILSLFELKPFEFNSPFAFAYKGNFEGISLFLMRPKKDPKFKLDSIGPETAAVVCYNLNFLVFFEFFNE